MSNKFSLNNLFSESALLEAFGEYKRGKSGKFDVLEFERNLEENIFSLSADLLSGRYEHGAYSYFKVFDNKKRDIHKAIVADRVVHHIMYKYLNSVFDRGFINETFSSRIGKGGLSAVKNLRYFLKIAGDDFVAIKFDIKKYFDSIDHSILLKAVRDRIFNDDVFAIIKKIVESFDREMDRSIPLGNVTSQVFANIYLDSFDKFVKGVLGVRFYVRYNDDFVILVSKLKVDFFVKEILTFMQSLKLYIPKEKIETRKIAHGVYFLGFKIFKDFVLVRNSTKNKIYENFSKNNFESYLSLLSHCDSFNLQNKLLSSI